MDSFIRPGGFTSVVRIIALCACTQFIGVESAMGGERVLVTRTGQRIPLDRSSTEFAVTLDQSQAASKAAPTLAAHSLGTLEDLAVAPNARTKILRVAETTKGRRQAVSRMAGIADVHSVYRVRGSDTPLFSSGTMCIRVRGEMTQAERDALWQTYQVKVLHAIDGVPNAYCVKPMHDDQDDVLWAAAMADDDRTVWSEPNFRVPAIPMQVGPSDEFFNLQWHLQNTGQTGGDADADIDATEAWLQAVGEDTLIGMFDTSCDVAHEDLRGNYLGVGHDPSLPSSDPGFEDPGPKAIGDDHGTAVMGLAVARANTVGGRGVAFLSRFTASRGLGDLLTNAEVAQAYTFALQQDVDVHINSWGFEGFPTPSVIEDAIETVFVQGRDLDGPDGSDPPFGMVVLFASGNGGDDFIGDENQPGFELSTLSTVIGVGASNGRDFITGYSNFGPEVDLLAPGGDEFGLMMTVDNDDNAGYVDNGFNDGGVDVSSGAPAIDPEGLYTGTFAGTSAACPVAAGVAALVLSVNQSLTATDVRLILEHTTDKVQPDDAEYESVTSRSLRYGYGRINAETAVQAAQTSLTNGGRTWPGRVANVRFGGTELRWVQNGTQLEFFEDDSANDDDTQTAFVPLVTTNEFLVLESDVDLRGEDVFSHGEFPVDGACYDARQLGCGSGQIIALPDGVQVLSVGCALSCGVGTTSECVAGAEQCVDFIEPSASKYYAIYARSSVGRYSFGVFADSTGNVLDEGTLPPGAPASVGGGGGGGGTAPIGPAVTIDPRPLSGPSPLTVRFKGNAVTDFPIDTTRTVWDFDIDDGTTNDATTTSAEHTYEVPDGESRTFIARLTMFDINRVGDSDQVAIRVDGQGGDSGAGGSSENLRIIVMESGGAAELDHGTAPFEVELRLQTTGLTGELQSVAWDLGDGSTATGNLVLHTYTNETQADLRLVITATITSITSGSTFAQTTVSKRITIEPGVDVDIPPDPSLDGVGATGPGGSASPCGPIGLIPLFASLGLMMMLRRRR